MLKKVIAGNGKTLMVVTGCYKNQKMCDRAVDNCPNTLDFLLECCKAKRTCDKAVNTYSAINLFLNAIRLAKWVVKL